MPALTKKQSKNGKSPVTRASVTKPIAGHDLKKTASKASNGKKATGVQKSKTNLGKPADVIWAKNIKNHQNQMSFGYS